MNNMNEDRYDRSAVLAAVEERREEIVGLLQEFVRIPTVNPPGEGYERFVGCMGDVLQDLGYEVELVSCPRLAWRNSLLAAGVCRGREERGSMGPGPVHECISTVTTTWSRWATTGPASLSAASSWTGGSTVGARRT